MQTFNKCNDAAGFNLDCISEMTCIDDKCYKSVAVNNVSDATTDDTKQQILTRIDEFKISNAKPDKWRSKKTDGNNWRNKSNALAKVIFKIVR